MHRTLFVLSFVLVALVPTSAFQVTKDPNALIVLSQLAAATGWDPASLPVDAIAEVVVTHNAKQESVSLTLRAMGDRKIRTDVQEAGITTVINADQAQVTWANRKIVFSPQSAISMRSLILPMFSEIPTAASDPGIAVSLRGTEVANGRSAYKVELVRGFRSDSPFAATLAIVAPLTLWIDVTTGLLLQAQHVQVAADNPNASITRVRRFSNYKVVNGLAVPFSQQDVINGQVTSTLQLTNVSFNVGLADAVFAISAE